MDPRQLLMDSFNAALKAVDPLRLVPHFLPDSPKGRTLVLGAGKAAASMALAFEQNWPAAAPLSGLVVTRYRHGLLTNRIKVIEAGHPVPDEAGQEAARELLRMAKSLGRDDLLVMLVSGGGSSLLALPATGLTMADLKETTIQLLRCGASIQEINVIRKHLSAILGGQLATATRARVVALIMSDVTGDDPTHISSGPCAPDPSTYADAAAILSRYGLAALPAVKARLQAGIEGGIPETPKPGDKAFSRVENRVIATSQTALQGAVRFFREKGLPAAILGDSVTGEASEAAKVHGALLRQITRFGEPWPMPIALISGGECTVTMRGSGRGGRCSEFLLALARNCGPMPNLWALACDTDGIDGSEDNAGALLLPDSLARATDMGVDPEHLAANNDSWAFFKALDDLVLTGPTRTNVNDYRVMLVL